MIPVANFLTRLKERGPKTQPTSKKNPIMVKAKNHPEKNFVENITSADHEITFWENSNEFFRNTSLHGLKFVGNENITMFERFFFLTAFILAFCVNIYFISNVYNKWNSTPVIISIDPTPTYIDRIPFPAITICNMNQASAKKVQNISKDSIEYSMLQTLCARDVELKSEAVNATNMWPKFRNFLINVTQPCYEMIRNCRLNSKRQICGDIFQPVLTDEGICCAFNLLKAEFMYKDPSNLGMYIDNFNPPNSIGLDWSVEAGYEKELPGKFYPTIVPGIGGRVGLILLLDAKYADYYCSTTNGAGFKILIHTPSETPKIADFGFFLPVGQESLIAIRPQKSDASQALRSMSRKTRQCLFENEGNLTFYDTYSRTNCEMECEATLMAKECNCIEYFMPRISTSIPICGLKDIECSQKISMRALMASDEKNECTDQCLPGCFELIYNQDIFQTPLYNGTFLTRRRYLRRYPEGYAKDNLAMVQFFYTENTFRTLSKEQFIGFTEFLSEAGGLMGLFLGFSVVSLVEIFYYITLRPWIKIWRLKHHTKFSKKVQQNASQPNNILTLRANQSFILQNDKAEKLLPLPYIE